MMLHTCSSWCH